MRILAAILFFVCSAANAQFVTGQILTAAQLNAAFANVLSTSGGTLTGPLTIPALNVTGASSLSSVAITGGTITGVAGTFTTLKGNSLAKVTYTNTSAQSIPNTTNATVTGWTSSFDQNANFNASTGVFTASSAGFYFVSASLQMNGTFAAGTNLSVKIAKNGATTFASTNSIGVSTANPQALVSGLFQMAAGDTLTVVTSQTSGGALPLTASGPSNFLSIAQIP